MCSQGVLAVPLTPGLLELKATGVFAANKFASGSFFYRYYVEYVDSRKIKSLTGACGRSIQVIDRSIALNVRVTIRNC